jgi:H+/gluconate symporter-like permease
VAYEFGIPIGTVILYTLLLGLPTAIISGIFIGGKIAKGIFIEPPELVVAEEKNPPSFWSVGVILMLPIILIVTGSLVDQMVGSGIAEGLSRGERGAQMAVLMKADPAWQQGVAFFGHPILALLLSTVLVLWVLGSKRGVKAYKLMEVVTNALGPAGIIILTTGAGGVFKGMLGKTGVGDLLADLLGGSA